MNQRSGRSSSIYGVCGKQLMQSQPIQCDTPFIFSKYIYQDLLKLRHQPGHNTRNVQSTAGSSTRDPRDPQCNVGLTEQAMQRIQEIMARRSNTGLPAAPAGGKAMVDKAVQLSFVAEMQSPAHNVNLLLSDKKNSLTEICASERPAVDPTVDTETCKHTNARFTIKDDNTCEQVSPSQHYIGSHSKKETLNRRHSLAAAPKSRPQVLEHISEEVLFSNGEGNCVDVGTAEFKNPLEKDSGHKSQLLEKEAHIEILRKLLSKSMKIIKSLHDQIGLLSQGTDRPADKKKHPVFDRLEQVLAEEVAEGNLEDIGHFLDALHNAATSENEFLLNKKVELLAEKYGDEAKSLAETLVKLTSRTLGGTNQFASPTQQRGKIGKMQTKGMDTSLSPIHTPGKSPNEQSVHKELLELYKQAEREMEQNGHKSHTRGNMQMTFQHDAEEPNAPHELPGSESQHSPSESQSRSQSQLQSQLSSPSPSVSREIRQWKTFVNRTQTKEQNSMPIAEKPQHTHNKSCAAIHKKPAHKADKGSAKENVNKRNKNPEAVDPLPSQTLKSKSKKPSTDHRRVDNSLALALASQPNLPSRRSSVTSIHAALLPSHPHLHPSKHNESLEENLTHIEAAMNNFIGGFKDLKTELLLLPS